MPRPKRLLHATALETSTPPDALSLSQFIARVICAQGKNIYAVKFSSPPNSSLLVELPVRFRSTIWMKRGSYVVVDTATAVGRNNKIRGEIVNIVRDEKEWRKMAYWYASLPVISKIPAEATMVLKNYFL